MPSPSDPTRGGTGPRSATSVMSPGTWASPRRGCGATSRASRICSRPITPMPSPGPHSSSSSTASWPDTCSVVSTPPRRGTRRRSSGATSSGAGSAFAPGRPGWCGDRSATSSWPHRGDAFPPWRSPTRRWPAHLHIDLLPQACGSGVGAALMCRWLDSLRAGGVPGCHLETLGENHGAIAFFESMGFRRHGELSPAPGLRSPTGRHHTVQVMVRDLRTNPAG